MSSEKTCVRYIQVELTKISYLWTLFTVRFIQDSSLFGVQFRNVSLYIIPSVINKVKVLLPRKLVISAVLGCPVYILLAFLPQKTLMLLGFSYLLIMTILDEGYSINQSFALNSISTLLLSFGFLKFIPCKTVSELYIL